MARTRRRTSYRRSRRWNPDAVPAPVTAKTNPRHRRGRKSRRNPRHRHHAKSARARRYFKGYSKRRVSHVIDYALGRFNPKRSGRGRARTNPKHSYRYVRGPKRGKFKRSLYRRHAIGRGRARTNPAQFPMPFFSAMTNPGRRGRKSRTRRNHPIKRKDARAMKRVLRGHGYRCSPRRGHARAPRKGDPHYYVKMYKYRMAKYPGDPSMWGLS